MPPHVDHPVTPPRRKAAANSLLSEDTILKTEKDGELLRVLLTGGSGFLGRQLCDQLARRGDEIVLFDLSEPDRKSLKDLGALYFKGDITSFRDVADCLSRYRFDGIINAAAKILGDQENPLETFRVNVLGLANVLEAARKVHAKVVSISTAGVYGKRAVSERLIENLPLNPEDTYEHTKALGESLAGMYVRRYGLDVRVVRFPFLYGPRQYVVWPLNIVLYHALAKRPLRLRQGGDYGLEYLYVKDAAAGAIAALRAERADSRVYNIGTGKCTTVREVVSTARTIFPEFDCHVGDGLWSSEMMNAWVRGPMDVERAGTELEFVAEFDIEKGMKDLAQWELEHLEELESWPKNELWIMP